MIEVLEALPEELRASAYVVEEEAAWPRALALQVVVSCAEKALAVLGGEVWLRDGPTPTIPMPICYHWDAGARADQESWPAFVQRCRQAAEQYIRRFDWDSTDTIHGGATPYFNLTICSERDYATLAPR